MAPIYISYTKNCQVPKEGHLGQFPANFCVKMTGTSGESDKNNENCDKHILL